MTGMRSSWWPVGRENWLALLMGWVWSAAAAAADVVVLSFPKYGIINTRATIKKFHHLRGPPRSGGILSTFITSAPGSSRRGISLPVSGLVIYERETWVGSYGSFMLSSITIGFMLYAAETTRRNNLILKSSDYSFIVLSSCWSLPLLAVRRLWETVFEGLL